MTEEQRQHEREQRELERIRVLEAAGLIISQPAEGKKPPTLPLWRRSTKKGRRPPPAAPVPSRPATFDQECELPLLPPSPRAGLDDAYERYEAFKNREATIPSTTNRDSIAYTTVIFVSHFESRCIEGYFTFLLICNAFLLISQHSRERTKRPEVPLYQSHREDRLATVSPSHTTPSGSVKPVMRLLHLTRKTKTKKWYSH